MTAPAPNHSHEHQQHGHDHDHNDGSGKIAAGRAARLMEPGRLETQLSEQDLVRLLALRGQEDVIELGSGAGFYTDRIAALTTGTVYGLDIQPGMHDFYRERGLPQNVRLITGDVTRLDLPAASVDVACSISTWHESDGVIDLPGLAAALRPGGRIVVVDWRRDADTPEQGPPTAVRFTAQEVASYLAAAFRVTGADSLGPNMFAVTAVRE